MFGMSPTLRARFSQRKWKGWIGLPLTLADEQSEYSIAVDFWDLGFETSARCQPDDGTENGSIGPS